MHQIKSAVPTHHRTGQALKGQDSGGCNTFFQDWEAQVRKNLHSPQCFPSWFIKHHLHCCTNNSTLLGDELSWNKPPAKPAAALPAPMLRAARPVRNHCTKLGSTLSSQETFDLEFNFTIYIFNLDISQISSERSASKELSSKGTATGSLWLTTPLWRAPEQTPTESMAMVSQRGVTDPRQWHQCLPSAHSLVLQISSSILKWNFVIGICAAKLSQFSLQCFA